MQGQAEKITGHRWNHVVEEYRVLWSGSHIETWEPASNLTQCEPLIREFQESNMVEPIDDFGGLPNLEIDNSGQTAPTPEAPKVADRFFLSPEPLPEVGREVKMSVQKSDTIFVGRNDAPIAPPRDGRKKVTEFRTNEDYGNYVHDLDDVPVMVGEGTDSKHLSVYWIGENDCKDPMPIDIDHAVYLCPSLVSKFFLKKLSPYFHLD